MTFGYWQFTRAIDEFGFTQVDSSAGYNFEKMDYDTKAFFTLSADIFLLCTYACFIPAFTTLLSLFMYKSVFAKNLEFNVLSTFFPVMFFITLMKLSFAAMLNFKEFNVETSSESTGAYGALVYLIVVGIFLAFLFI